MSNVIPCSCQCNTTAVFADGLTVSVGDLVRVDNTYSLTYEFTNKDPALSHIVFCIDCPPAQFLVSATSTSVAVSGFVDETPIAFSEDCSSSPADNTYCIEYSSASITSCCPMQGVKVNLEPADDITRLEIDFTVTVPETVTLTLQGGTLRLKRGQLQEVVGNLCVPSCCTRCDICEAICELWQQELKLVEQKQEVLTSMGETIVPPDADLNLLDLSELEDRIILLNRLECCLAELDCSIATLLNALNSIQEKKCEYPCLACPPPPE